MFVNENAKNDILESKNAMDENENDDMFMYAMQKKNAIDVS